MTHNRYIPAKGDRFQVFYIVKRNVPTQYEKYILKQETKYYLKEVPGGKDCICENRNSKGILASNPEGEIIGRFCLHEFYFVKKAPAPRLS